jgi:hypothetical protein
MKQVETPTDKMGLAKVPIQRLNQTLQTIQDTTRPKFAKDLFSCRRTTRNCVSFGL